MADNAYERGRTVRGEVLGAAHVERSLANASEFAKPMQELVTEYCWGGVWSRPGLERRDRSLINLGMLTALNRSHELAVHVRGALTNGCTVSEIQETLLQAAIYCGVPAAMEAFRVAEEAIVEVRERAVGRVLRPRSVSAAPVIGFVGVGAMGAPIVEALAATCNALIVHDSDPRAVEPAVARGATAYGSPAEVANAADLVFVSLPRPAVVKAVALGEGGLVEGTRMRTYIDLSTTGAVVAEEVATALAAKGRRCSRRADQRRCCRREGPHACGDGRG